MTAGGRFAVVLSAHKRVLDYNGITEHGEKREKIIIVFITLYGKKT